MERGNGCGVVLGSKDGEKKGGMVCVYVCGDEGKGRRRRIQEGDDDYDDDDVVVVKAVMIMMKETRQYK